LYVTNIIDPFYLAFKLFMFIENIQINAIL